MRSGSLGADATMLQRKLEPMLTQTSRGEVHRAQLRKLQPKKSPLTNLLELTFVATHMVPPLVLHCLNILTLGQYVMAGCYSAHQLSMTLLSILSPYIPLTKYQRYCLRIPCNVLITIAWWRVVGFADFSLNQTSAMASCCVGVFCTLLWVCGAKLFASKALESRAWNPYSRHEGPRAHLLVLGRLINSSVFTPFWEEVYDRGFVYRVLVNVASRWQTSSFELVPLSHVNIVALVLAVTFFGAGHTRFHAEPLLGMLFALIMHSIVFWFKSLGPAVLAHAVCNLTLGLWVIYAQDWMFW